MFPLRNAWLYVTLEVIESLIKERLPMKKSHILFTVFLALFAWNVSSFAHEEHCHKKGEDGKLVDWDEHKDEKSCEAAGGVWEHHHEHCHKAGADGKMADFPSAKNKKACAKAGGQWTDHGHEGLK